MSEHTQTMSYPQMAEDMKRLIPNDEKATLIGHSMGGRTAMYLALTNPSLGIILFTSPKGVNIFLDVNPDGQGKRFLKLALHSDFFHSKNSNNCFKC